MILVKHFDAAWMIGVTWLIRQLRVQIPRLSVWPPVGWVRFGNLRRVEPISRIFGSDRGQCVDRYYIEKFLERHSKDIRGTVLEVAENTYTRKFGGDRVETSHILHVQAGNPKATIIGNLATGENLSSESFDCIILTQTMHLIYDIKGVVETVHRILKPGGVVLVTLPGISQISRYDMNRWGDFWRFTTASAERLFGERFAQDFVSVRAHGNVLVANAFLTGLASKELTIEELEHEDGDYQVLITVRAQKC